MFQKKKYVKPNKHETQMLLIFVYICMFVVEVAEWKCILWRWSGLMRELLFMHSNIYVFIKFCCTLQKDTTANCFWLECLCRESLRTFRTNEGRMWWSGCVRGAWASKRDDQADGISHGISSETHERTKKIKKKPI